jgi:hypothetical protein
MHFISRLREPVVCAALALGISVAQADHAPAFVVPGRADVPVMINGYDASWGVVEGDWGLYRPGFVSPTVIPAPTAAPLAPARHYFPSLGAVPYSGRYEIEPPANRVLPRPAPTYHREWSTSSDTSVPATAPNPQIITSPAEGEGYGDDAHPRDPRHARGLLPRHRRGLLPINPHHHHHH